MTQETGLRWLVFVALLVTRQAGCQVVNTYVAMQAAVASHAYDPNTPGRSLTSTHLTWDSGTPDRYANFWTTGAPCYFNNPLGAGTYVNFYNTTDWALRLLWTLDPDAKPDDSACVKAYSTSTAL